MREPYAELFVRFVLDVPERSGQGGSTMTSAQTRMPAELLTRLAGACALILFVVILILPH
jgi:hypothetical protein